MQAERVNAFVCSVLRELRIERRIRVAEMAQRTGIPLGSYSCLETGRYRMSLENLFRIGSVLGVSIQDLWPEMRPAQDVDDAVIEKALHAAQEKRLKPIAIEEVLEAVTRVFEISIKELASSSRNRHLAQARTAAALVVREVPHRKLAELSRLLNRATSSLSHSIARVKTKREQPHFWEEVERARKMLKRG